MWDQFHQRAMLEKFTRVFKAIEELSDAIEALPSEYYLGLQTGDRAIDLLRGGEVLASVGLERETVHELKTWPEWFEAAVSEGKDFEVRRNDREFQVGDKLVLREYVPQRGGFPGYYTGRVLNREITFTLPGGQFGVEEGYIVLGLTDFEIADH